MHRRYVNLVLLLLCFFSCKKTKEPFTLLVVEKSTLNRDLKTGIMLYNNLAFTGKAQLFYRTNSLAEETFYVNGIKHGLRLKWFPNGNQSFSGNYQNGRRDGEVKSWWNNGQLRTLAFYKKGVATGTQKEWYKSGQLFKKYTLIDGQEAGLQQAWRENGQLYNNYVAKAGKIYGLKRSNLCFKLQNEQIIAH